MAPLAHSSELEPLQNQKIHRRPTGAAHSAVEPKSRPAPFARGAHGLHPRRPRAQWRARAGAGHQARHRPRLRRQGRGESRIEASHQGSAGRRRCRARPQGADCRGPPARARCRRCRRTRPRRRTDRKAGGMERRRGRAAHSRAPLPRQAGPSPDPARWRAGLDAGRLRRRRWPESARLFRPGRQDPGQAENARVRRLSPRGGRFGTGASGREARGGTRIRRARGDGGRGPGRRPCRHRAVARGPPGAPARARRRDHWLSQVRAGGQPHRARDASYSACLFPRCA